MARLQVLNKDDNGSFSLTNRYSYLYSSDDSSSRLASYCTKRDCSFDPENAVEQGAQYSRMFPRCLLALSSYLPSVQHTIKHLPNSIEYATAAKGNTSTTEACCSSLEDVSIPAASLSRTGFEVMRCVSDKGMISIKVHFHRELLAEDGGTPFTCSEGGRWFLQLRVSARTEYGL